MADEQNTEVNTETLEKQDVQQEEVKQEADKIYSKDDLASIMTQRVAKEKARIYKELGVDNLDDVKNILREKEQSVLEEKKKRGEFEDVLKEQASKYQEQINGLQSQIQNIKVNDALLNSAVKGKAINPNQVADLLRNNVKLNDDGQVEVLADNGTPRYNQNGELLGVEDYVQEFLTQNPHFLSATPSGSGSKGNVGKVDAKPLNLADLDLNNPEDRKRYAEYRKTRNGFNLRPQIITNN
tara:strand:- start:68 stop:787 length:720 start_codon:yes stop_codon:yes gene_type:complete